MKLTWEFILRDLVPFVSAQFFVVFLVYFTIVRNRIARVYPFYAAALAGLIVFMGGGILREFPLDHSVNANLYVRFATLFAIALPSISVALGLQTGRRLIPQWALLAYGFGAVCAVLYVSFHDLANHGNLALWLNQAPGGSGFLEIPLRYAHTVQLLAVSVLLLLPASWFLLNPAPGDKPHALLWSAFSLGCFLAIGTATGKWWIYYTGSTVSALLLGIFVGKDVLSMKQRGELSESEGIAPEVGSEPQQPSTTSNDLASRARNFIHAHFAEDLSVETVAASLNVSQSHLMAVFKRETGSTLIQYLVDYRLQRACELLRSKSVTEVAFEVGFNSSSYFSTVFRKVYGVSPKVYQKSHKSASNHGSIA